MLRLLQDPAVARPPFACPFLIDGKTGVGQTAAILLHLGPKLRLAAAREAARLWVHQVQLTIADLVQEVHAVHPPVASARAVPGSPAQG